MHTKEFASASGEARKWMLQQTTYRAGIKARWFEGGLRDEYTLLANYWATRGLKLDPKDLKFTFTPNLPREDLQEAQTAVLQVQAGLSKETIFSNMAVVDNAQEEIDRANEEKMGVIPYGLLEGEDDNDRAEGNEEDEGQESDTAAGD